MEPEQHIQTYLDGPGQLQQALQAVTEDQADLHPVPDTWSIRQVVCHLADAEIVYADRIKRVLTEENPTLFEWDPDTAAELCTGRILSAELDVIQSVRHQMATILRHQDVEVWQRTAVHSKDGPLTLETLVERITGHIPHHLAFIEQKQAALTASR